MSPEASVLVRRVPAPEVGPVDLAGGVSPFEVFVEVHGEADSYTAPQLHHDLASALPVVGPHLVFELSGLTFCDFAGLDALVAAERGALAQRRSVRWSGEPARLAWLRSTFGGPNDPFEPAAVSVEGCARRPSHGQE